MKINISIGYFALVLILAVGVATGCIRSQDKEYGGKGEILHIGAHEPKLVDEVIYSIKEQNYVIAAQGEGNKIAALRARAVNLTSTQIILSVDETVITLNSKDGVQFKPLEPDTIEVETKKDAPEGNPYSSHIWGTLKLNKGFEMSGWLFFEVPKGTEFANIVWDTVEFVRVIYSH
jgi:hypothetical protein